MDYCFEIWEYRISSKLLGEFFNLQDWKEWTSEVEGKRNFVFRYHMPHKYQCWHLKHMERRKFKGNPHSWLCRTHKFHILVASNGCHSHGAPVMHNLLLIPHFHIKVHNPIKEKDILKNHPSADNKAPLLVNRFPPYSFIFYFYIIPTAGLTYRVTSSIYTMYVLNILLK